MLLYSFIFLFFHGYVSASGTARKSSVNQMFTEDFCLFRNPTFGFP